MEVCKICGTTVDILTEVHCKKHGLTKEEYRKEHGEDKIKNTFRIPRYDYNEADKYLMGVTRKKSI